MADHISFDMVTKPFDDGLAYQQKTMRRAAMYSLRETGRVVAREAKSRAPVLSDKSATTVAQMRRDIKFRNAGQIGPVRGGKGSGPLRGLLKASIRPSRQLKPAGLEAWKFTVGPRGARVHLYAGKIERSQPFMAPARAAAEVQATAIAWKVYYRVWKK